MTMQTYLNSIELKARFLDEIGKHEAADQLIKGSYGEGIGKHFRGCAIGCSLHSLNMIDASKLTAPTGDHTRYQTELGLPIWLAYLEDNVFEQLPLDLAKTWPRRFAEAIPVGAVVTDVVLAKILRWCLADAEFGVRFATDDKDIRGYIDVIVAMFDAEIATNCQATAEQREAAARDARDARAAWAARDAWAARAAWAARDAWAARAARAATNSSRTEKKADAFFPALSEFVLGLLRELPAASGGAQ